MKKTTLIPLSLLAAAASAFAQANTSNTGPSYNRIEVGYVGSSDQNGIGVSTEALIGSSNFFVAATYVASSGRGNLSGISSRGIEGDLGYKIKVGPGNIDLTVGYLQSQISESSLTSVAYLNAIAFGVAWRQSINQAIEYSIGYQHVNGSGVQADAGYPITKDSNSDDLISAKIHYHFLANWEVAAGYAWSNNNNSVWSVGFGYNF
jgi:hypothetical protein